VEQQLIQLYLWVCRVYDTQPDLKAQRMSNNHRPPCTDQELMTVYLFGHLRGHFTQRRIYDYVAGHWRAWFPALPSYQAFNRRLNRLSASFAVVLQDSLAQSAAQLGGGSDRLLDSLPVMLAKGARGDAARVARPLAAKGYCASKRLYYHGVKLHVLARKRYKRLPVPESLVLTSAAVHDLTAFQQALPWPQEGALFGDKAYGDAQTRAALAARQVTLCVPEKRPLGCPRDEWHTGLWSRFVSAMRQPLESCFNWLIQRAGIQDAAKVRSTEGLLVHCYGKLTVCCFLLLFNS
jgi:hypothetical protein